MKRRILLGVACTAVVLTFVALAGQQPRSLLVLDWAHKAPAETVPVAVLIEFGIQDTKVANMRLFTDMMVDGVHCGPDGLRADVTGALWCSSNAPLGYSGVLVFNPQGKLIGRIRLPEVCGNVCFGGPKRNRLFMAASQSLYAVYTATQGAAPG